MTAMGFTIRILNVEGNVAVKNPVGTTSTMEKLTVVWNLQIHVQNLPSQTLQAKPTLAVTVLRDAGHTFRGLKMVRRL